MRLAGLSGVGKTRLVQALFEEDTGEKPLSQSKAIYADLGMELIPTATEILRQLITTKTDAILVLDNCPPGIHNSLAKELSESDAPLKLLTVEYDVQEDKPENTKAFRMAPVGDKVVEKLVCLQYPEISQANASKIAHFADGNARVALSLADNIDPSENLAMLSNNDLFDRLFYQRQVKDTPLRERAEALSLVYSYDLDDEISALGEISINCKRSLLKASYTLQERGLVQQRGGWRAVLPHAISNRLASKALEYTPLDEIMQVLCHRDHKRLLKSFARRVGLLHDSIKAQEAAKYILNSESLFGGLCDLSTDSEYILQLIAPTIPEAVLKRFETEIDPDFASRQNKHHVMITNLLVKIAYDEDLFERAIRLLLRFAKTERANENGDNIRNKLRCLFSISHSGTLASLKVKQTFLEQLLISKDPTELETVADLLKTGLSDQLRGIVCENYEFGARSRSTGFGPASQKDLIEWKEGHIELMVKGIVSRPDDLSVCFKIQFAACIQRIWRNIGFREKLEQSIREISSKTLWPEGLLALYQIKFLDFRRLKQSDQDRLQALIDELKPKDLSAELETYLFQDIHKFREEVGVDYQTSEATIIQKIKQLGRRCASDLSLVRDLGPRLFVENKANLFYFGYGLLRDYPYQRQLFEELMSILHHCSDQKIDIAILGGAIQGIAETDENLAEDLLLEIKDDTLLKKYVVFLEIKAGLSSQSTERLLSIAEDEEIPATAFLLLIIGMAHKAFSNERFTSLIQKLILKNNGIEVSIDLFKMRFFGVEDSNQHSAVLLECARKVVFELAASKRSQFSDNFDYGLAEVCQVCFADQTGLEQIERACFEIFRANTESRIYSFYLEKTLCALANLRPSAFLNALYSDKMDFSSLQFRFEDDSFGREQPLWNVSADKLIEWCNQQSDDHFAGIAKMMNPFSNEEASSSDENGVGISEKVLTFLNAAPNPQTVVSAFYSNIAPSGWSGSLADVLEQRRLVLDTLISSPNQTISETANSESAKLQERVQAIRREEQIEIRRYEESFE